MLATTLYLYLFFFAALLYGNLTKNSLVLGIATGLLLMLFSLNSLINPLQIESGFTEYVAAQDYYNDNTDQKFYQNFTDTTNFIYDSDKVEFIGGTLRQKRVIPDNLTFYAKYTTTLDASYLISSNPTATINGNITLNGTYATFNGQDNSYLQYDTEDMLINPQQGTINFKFIPKYNGKPIGSDQYLFSAGIAPNELINRFEMRQRTTGIIKVLFYNSDTTQCFNDNFGTASFNQDQEYDIELNYNFLTNETRLFIDGAQFGFTRTHNCVLNDTITMLRVGNNPITGGNNNTFFIKEFVIYNETQHTSNYNVSENPPCPCNPYTETNVTIPTFSYSGDGEIQQYTDFETIATTATQYTINNKYYNAAWLSSDESYTQSTDETTTATHITELTAQDETTIKIHFPASNTLQSINNLTLTYTGQDVTTAETTIRTTTYTNSEERNLYIFLFLFSLYLILANGFTHKKNKMIPNT